MMNKSLCKHKCGCITETDYFCPTCFHNFNETDSFFIMQSGCWCPKCYPVDNPPKWYEDDVKFIKPNSFYEEDDE